MKISDIVKNLNEVKKQYDDLDVWLKIVYNTSENTIRRTGPIECIPTVYNRKNKKIVQLWANEHDE